MILEEMADEAAAEKGSLSRSVAAAGQAALDRFVSFRITYVAVFAFLLLFVITIGGTEALLQRQFSRDVARAVVVRSFDRPIAAQIELGVRQAVYQSRWLGIGGLRVSTQVFSRDGTLIFLNGRSLMPPSSGLDPASIMRESERLRPLSGSVSVSLPIGSLLSSAILVAYATVLLWTLFFYNKRVVSRENAILGEAQAARDATLRRTEEIEAELDTVRRRVREVEPAEREHAEEIRGLQRERESLHTKLASLAQREEELRSKAAHAVDLDQERQALEDLLEEAASDLSSKDDEILNLEKSVKRASKQAASAGSGRGREGDLLSRRLRTLYKNLEIDERAIDDLVKLRDETMKLKAEESLKRLADEQDNVAVRRKVGGLPPYLSIFELGFAGKGRIYYTRGRQRRFRVLCVGAKNTQKPDLEYLSRLPREA